jgi:hypothetical protein
LINGSGISPLQFIKGAPQLGTSSQNSYTKLQSANSTQRSFTSFGITDVPTSEEDIDYSYFIPWGKSAKGFVTDVFLSFVTYVATYWFLSRMGVLHMHRFNNLIKKNLKTPAEREEFNDVLKKITKMKPMVNIKYWNDYYDKYLLRGEGEYKLESNWDKNIASLYKVVLGLQNRNVLALIISGLSVGRALAVNPATPLWVLGFIGLGPWLTNTLFARSEKTYIALAQNISEKYADSQKPRLNSFGEVFNITYKVFAKSLKRMNNGLTFSVALFSSLISRGTRDILEDGLPKLNDENETNPIMRWLSRRTITQKLRDVTTEDNPLQRGLFKDTDKTKSLDNPTWVLMKNSAKKTGFKYATDIVVFGIIGLSLLKVIHFFKHLLYPGHNDYQIEYTDVNTINKTYFAPLGIILIPTQLESNFSFNKATPNNTNVSVGESFMLREAELTSPEDDEEENKSLSLPVLKGLTYASS